MLFLYILDGVLYTLNLIIFIPYPFELPLHPLLEIEGLKQKLAIIQLLLLLDLLVILIILIFLLQGQLLILINKGIALPLELLEVLIQRSIHILHTIDHHHHEHIVRGYTRTNELIYILGNTRQTLLQYFLILLLHAYADPQLHSFVLEGRDRAVALRLAGSDLIDENTLRPTALREIGLLEQRDIVIHGISLERFEGGDERRYRLKSL